MLSLVAIITLVTVPLVDAQSYNVARSTSEQEKEVTAIEVEIQKLKDQVNILKFKVVTLEGEINFLANRTSHTNQIVYSQQTQIDNILTQLQEIRNP